jgi:hypothetical protein
MMKATLRSAVLLGLTAAWAVPSFAEVQNVKVGGEVTVRAFHRSNLDLHDDRYSSGKDTTVGLNADNFIMQTTAVNIGADLTENVSATLRLTNERDWDTTGAETLSDFDMSQAYVTLKELFYSPLTVRIGTQPIVWGRGFVLGSNLFPTVNSTGDDRNAALTANEFTDFTAFDAIRATLDLSNVLGGNLPLTVDYVYIKLDENAAGTNDDVFLQGVNLSTRFAQSEVEAYFLNKRDNTSVATPAGSVANDNHGRISTLGIRGSGQPLEGAYLYGELAYQFGQLGVDPAGVLAVGDAQQAWAFDLGAQYTLANVATTPTLGGEWRFYSGRDVNGAAGGWAPMAPGYFTTALREFQTQSTVAGFYANDQAGVTSAGTNQHEFALYGSLKPIEDLTIAPRLSWFVLDVGALPTAGARREHFLGTELDTNITYNYTDDVQLGLLYAFFAPGSVYRTPNDAGAHELVTTVSVKF